LRNSHWKIYEAENGKVAACEIRQHTPQTKVILIRSHYTPEEAAMLARLFADGAFIQKSEAGKGNRAFSVDTAAAIFHAVADGFLVTSSPT